jgi:hypothetical protein
LNHEYYRVNPFDRHVVPCVRRGRLLLEQETVGSCPSYGTERNSIGWRSRREVSGVLDEHTQKGGAKIGDTVA